MSLERGVPIGLGRVPGIIGFGGEAQIGESEVPGDADLLTQQGQFGARHQFRMDEKSHEQEKAASGNQQESVGFSQGLVSIMSAGSPRSNPGEFMRPPRPTIRINPGF